MNSLIYILCWCLSGLEPSRVNEVDVSGWLPISVQSHIVERRLEPQEVIKDSKYWISYIDGLNASNEEKSWLKRVAYCESTWREGVVSPGGSWRGLYQYDLPTWNENCSGDIFDGHAQVACTLKLYRRGESSRWPNCGK